jgi:hypothetical protein
MSFKALIITYTDAVAKIELNHYINKFREAVPLRVFFPSSSK